MLPDHSLTVLLIRIIAPMGDWELLDGDCSDIVDLESFECELYTQCLDCAGAEIWFDLSSI
jgi:hypothetical protein